ncbi:Zn(II)2Cys6 transcription factor [Lasiodiplodia theobromae]|uniref:Zn(II)2Cys6 transcription factor n=1 Tax=Lasiodiplodia theobromae TaxID=45133 RepID=UPI0015C34F49|nr:Zn(II)2Cys6 transcription factor [Lasiodiplodia theobromae]KAF4543796.1 Zn(II)2Cys6 transcription factor [Lasiodiplodia theobromae]
MAPEQLLNAQHQSGTATASRTVRRKYTSKACEECRHRKIDCRYRFEEDGRRPAPKSYVQLLRNRIEVLERVLRSHGIDFDAEVARLAAEDDTSQTIQASASTLPQSQSSAEFEELCVAFEGALSFDESLNFDQDGELRYFGPTSGRLDFHPCGYKGTDFPSDIPQPLPHDIQPTTLTPPFEEDPIVPEHVREELIDHYFLYDQPWLQVVNEALFRESYRSGGRFCTPLLLNCILALGSRFTERPDLRSDPDDSNTAGIVFLDKAKVLLSLDMKRPSTTTLQSLCLISTMCFAIGADAAGWLHSGMAMRLALDMGMNLDSDLLARSELMSAEEADLRRQIYWSLYCDDKLAASYTGRVCTMLGVVKIPSNSKPPLTALISLSRILEKILMGLYAPKPALKGQQKAQFLSCCILELKNWFYDLPSEMRIDRLSEKRAPQVYTTHMVYHTSFILLMKPFLAKDQPEEAQSAERSDMAKKAAAICHEASRQMILVARKYQHLYGSFRKSPVTATHCSLSAALTLMHISKLNGEEVPKANSKHARMIEACLEVLQELSTSWDIARRLRENLVKLYEQFCGSEGSLNQAAQSGASGNVEKTIDHVSQLTSPAADDALPFFLEGPSTEVGGYNALGDFTEDMLLDESLWGTAGQDLTFDPLQSEYMGTSSLDRWRFDDIW